ncbi:hypothetical protein HQQ94_17805 [Shewanella sp. VB17]|uniref:hypothetical protein n=1 Tax=Shewanella sp. VB17 TaxID=2739432 RepID=UPI0015657BB7|nr:hypothetical protein [Shewanella sp. VB17]NRD75037.1 hypothetical protein [Shewanella sp. VB17]
MNDIVNIDVADGDPEVVIMGDGNAASQISFQLAQDFYNEITGKSEKLKERENDSFVLTLSNIEQLHHRVYQFTEQYNICSSNEIYSVKYVDDSSERYSSLDRLKLHAECKGSAVESINIQYNLLIILPKTQRPQEYKSSVTLVSRIAKIEGIKEELGPMGSDIPLYQFERMKTAVFSIDYIDVGVANALMSVLKGWYNGLEKNNTNNFLKLSRELSHYFPKLFKYSFLGLTSYYSYVLSNHFVVDGAMDLRPICVFILSSLLVSFLSYKTGHFLGRKAEVSLDRIYEQSYIHFSGADENFVKNSSLKNRKNLYLFLGSTTLTIILGACGSLIASGIIAG